MTAKKTKQEILAPLLNTWRHFFCASKATVFLPGSYARLSAKSILSPNADTPSLLLKLKRAAT